MLNSTESTRRSRIVLRSLQVPVILLLLVASVLGAPSLPPKELLGFQVGEDRKLADWGQITNYFRHLNRTSRKLRLVELGPSTLGRPMLMAIITSPRIWPASMNIARLSACWPIPGWPAHQPGNGSGRARRLFS